MNHPSPAPSVSTDSSAGAMSPNHELTATRLALLADLEASLGASHRAVLAKDVAALNHATAEQARLRRALEVLLKPIGDGSSSSSRQRESLGPEVQAAAARILHLARVQRALLRRAQQFLSVLAHFAAGPGTTYSELVSSRAIRSVPPTALATSATLPLSLSGEPEDGSCRV